MVSKLLNEITGLNMFQHSEEQTERYYRKVLQSNINAWWPSGIQFFNLKIYMYQLTKHSPQQLKMSMSPSDAIAVNREAQEDKMPGGNMHGKSPSCILINKGLVYKFYIVHILYC